MSAATSGTALTSPRISLRSSGLHPLRSSRLRSLLCILLRSPFPHERATAAGVTLRKDLGAFDAVGAEHPEVVAQFAPAGHVAPGLEEAQHDRPDDALGPLACGVQIDDPHFALFAHRPPDDLDVPRRRLRRGTADVQ